MLYFVENLTLRTWLFAVLPKLVRERNQHSTECYFIDASRFGMLAAEACARLLPRVSVDRLKFRLLDVRDERGLLERLKIPYIDLEQVQAHAMSQPAFHHLNEQAPAGRLLAFVKKNLIKATVAERQPLWRAMMLIKICAWSARQQSKNSEAVVFMESRPWFSTIQWYARKSSVSAFPVHPTVNLRALCFRWFSTKTTWLIRELYHRILYFRFAILRKKPADACRLDQGPRLAVEYTGYFNLNRPECYSDFFFWHESDLPSHTILMTTALPQDPIDADRAAELAAHHIDVIALHARATKVHSVPLFTHWPRCNGIQERNSDRNRAHSTIEDKWIAQQVRDYDLKRQYWAELFRTRNVKLFVTWYRYDGTHCAIADALQSNAGITAIYQRACQPDHGPEIAIHTDIAFGYSPFDADVEKRSGSVINFHVSVGYLGDHRFPLLKGSARDLRVKLERCGAQFIIAFFDENSHADERWHTGHTLQRENYISVLEKVLSDRSVGLILKPKVPSTLKKRLGPVAELLERAQSTGRCYLYQEGIIQGSYPPAGAAMAADLAIHGHACAATAPLEAALAGIRTIMIDREGWGISPIYELGIGRVIFRSWTDVWDAVLEYRKNPNAVPGFGNWSPMLEKLDPFRDGRAAYRMGTYLGWLLKDLSAGRDRMIAMADAAQRYCDLWGYDKVAEINVGSQTLTREGVSLDHLLLEKK